MSNEIPGGYSGARVFIAYEQQSPDDPEPFGLVFKVHAGKALREEVRRFQLLSQHARAHGAFAQIIEPTLTLDSLSDHRLGAIAYEHVSSAFAQDECRPLRELLTSAVLGVGTEDTEEIVDTTLRAIGSLYSSPESSFAFPIARYYLERWAPHFRVAIDAVASAGPSPLLTERRFNPEHFVNEPETPAALVRTAAEGVVEGFTGSIALATLHPAYFIGDAVFLHGPTPDELALEVDIGALPVDARRRFESSPSVSLWVSVSISESRYAFYSKRLTAAFPECDFSSDVMELHGQRLRNPLSFLSAPLVALTKPPARTRLVPAHGDLHVGNILVVGVSPVVIDYGLSDTRVPVGVDAARLFGSILKDVVAPNVPSDELLRLLGSLLSLEFQPAVGESGATSAFRLLHRVQSRALQIAGDGAEGLWPLHLYGYALLALKWNSPTLAEHRACGMLAAVALTRLLGPLDEASALSVESCAVNGSEVVPQYIAVEGPAEILVLVAKFAGEATYDPTGRIYGALADHLLEVIPEIGRVEYIEDVVRSRRDAIALAARFQASMVVWGSYDELGIRPRYEVTRDSIVAQQSFIQLEEATRHNLKQAFDVYITDDLASEISFLSLKAVGDMCVLNLNLNAARRVYERALSVVKGLERMVVLGAPDIYMSLAGSYFALKDYTKANDASKKALQLAPDNVLAQIQQLMIRAFIGKSSAVALLHELVALLHQRLATHDLPETEREDLRKAIATLEGVKSQDDLRELAKSAVELESSHDDKWSASEHNRQFAKDVVSHIKKGNVLQKKKRYKYALKEYRLALRLNPKCVTALVNIAQILAVLDHVPEAMRELELAAKIDSSDGTIHYARAQMLASAGQYADTLVAVERAVDFGVPRAMCLWAWGVAMVGMGRGFEMMTTLKREPVDPANASFYQIRAAYFRRVGQYEAALRELNQAIDIEPDESLNFIERALTNEAIGHRDAAVADARHARDLAGGDSFARRKAERLLKQLTGDDTSVLAS